MAWLTANSIDRQPKLPAAFSHFGVSSEARLPNSTGVIGGPSISAMRALTFGSARRTARRCVLSADRCYFGGKFARALENEGDGALAAFVIDQISAALGNAMRKRLHPIIE